MPALPRPAPEKAARARRPPQETSVRLLMDIVAAEAPVSASHLAARQRMTPRHVLRQLAPLIEMGLIACAPNRALMPGPGIHALAGLFLRRSQLVVHAAPLLHELTVALGRPVSLGVLWQTAVCPLYHGDATSPVEQAIAPDSRLIPAEQCAIGLILLANRPWSALVASLAANGYDEAARADLALRLQTVHHQQYALAPDRDSVAVSVGTGAVAAVAAHGPIAAGDLPELLGQLRRCAAAISERLHRRR